MSALSRFWQQKVFDLVLFCCIQFVVLTVVAMFFYAGGNAADPTAPGYSFFRNFFSSLGLITSRAGNPNTISAILFFVSLSLAGVGLVLFSLAFPRFFWGTRSGQVLSLLGAVAGVLSGLCFVGVAWSPADLFFEPHVFFVIWAFRLFPIAVLFFAIAVFRKPDYSNGYGWALVVFGLLLVGYLVLMTAGPPRDSPGGLIVQATGQKTIVYAAIISTWIQAVGANRKMRSELNEP